MNVEGANDFSLDTFFSTPDPPPLFIPVSDVIED
jgi:hypothetical protein